MDAPSNDQVTETPPKKDKGTWKQLIQTLIRPPKHTYSKSTLGLYSLIQVPNVFTSSIKLFVDLTSTSNTKTLT